MTDVVRISTPRLTIEGRSRAGNESWFRVRELAVALDIGRCPDVLIGVPHIFVTHSHLDHALGIPFYASQRNLQSLPVGTVYVPTENLEDFQELMRIHGKLESTTYDLELVGMKTGDERELRRDLVVRAHASTHRVAARSYEFLERRRRLLPQFQGESGEELARLRGSDVVTTADELHSLLLYTGDTDAGIFDTATPLFDTDVLMIECSFVDESDRSRAARYTHLHLDDIFERADMFRNEMIILTHFSLRNSPAAIHAEVDRRCPAILRDRLHLALPEPYSRPGGFG